MEIYVSDDIYEYLTIGKRDIHSGVDDDLIVKSLEQHEEEIRKPLEDEIIELKEHIRALKSSHDLSHQAYLFAKNEGLDLQKQARLKVIVELEEWLGKQPTATYWLNNNEGEEHLPIEKLKQKLKEMKGEK